MPSVTFKPSNATIHCHEDQTIAQAAALQGVEIYLGCDNGVCMICQAERISGEFHFRNTLGQDVLESEDRVLCCVAKPQTDTELYMPSVATADFIEPRTFACQIADMQKLSEEMWRVKLRLPAGKKAEFWAGQYLLMHVTDETGIEEQVPYSIACAPSVLTGADPRLLELHISSYTDKAQSIIAFLQQAVVVRATLPFGECFVNQRLAARYYDKDLLLVASGSGFSQIKSLVEALQVLSPTQRIHLYWSNKDEATFYLSELPKSWAKANPLFSYQPILEQPKEGWSGRTGFIYQVIAEDFADLSKVEMIACGSPNMVYGTLDALAHLGLTQANMRADVFDYAPRD